MADLIQLLPDAIANQIAAGEVIQRPASVVKELIENAIDAGSTKIRLIIKDSGKTLIQIIDNGCGMSETDARMSFERHATSKIREANDLFAIRTMGFRGEAMASIAAIAQVEMKTRRPSSDLGVVLVVEGSNVKKQEPCQAPTGTSISVKNLFFNVPARRNFLKSNSVEMRHIMDEFQFAAIANPDIFFSLHHNESEVFHLPPGNLRQRLINIFGNKFNQRLVPISEETDILNFEGFIGKPEFARKTRGEQFFFVNQRFIKSPYLHHAIMGAYEALLPKGTFPFYVIFIEIDPEKIDINVHPTKQEIKFEDERMVYNYLRVATRHALGQHNIMPTLDFDQDTNFAANLSSNPSKERDISNEKISPQGGRASGSYPNIPKQSIDRSNLQNWEKLFDGLEEVNTETAATPDQESNVRQPAEGTSMPLLDVESIEPYQIHASFIVSQINSGFLLINQYEAHQRILYEKYLKTISNGSALTQQQLFPTTIKLSVIDAEIFKDMLPDLKRLGFEIEDFGNNDFIINDIPADMVGKQNEIKVIEGLLEQYQLNVDLQLDTNERIARSLAQSTAMKNGKKLSVPEMELLIEELFLCEIPYKSPSGKNCFLTFELEELYKRFDA